jgi:hypothetical protein
MMFDLTPENESVTANFVEESALQKGENIPTAVSKYALKEGSQE